MGGVEGIDVVRESVLTGCCPRGAVLGYYPRIFTFHDEPTGSAHHVLSEAL
jgi:hypothetical protein